MTKLRLVVVLLLLFPPPAPADPGTVVDQGPGNNLVFAWPTRICGISGSAGCAHLTGIGGNFVLDVNIVGGSSATAAALDTGTCTSVTGSTTVLASNTARHAAIVLADPANTDKVHVKLGATATTSNPKLVAGQSLAIDGAGVYTGVIDAIAASGTQTVCTYSW